MKNKVRPLIYILLIISFLIIYGNKINGQEKVNISAGFGVPELIHVGVHRQLDQFQIGLNIGVIAEEYFIFSISGDIYYHFGGTSELSNRRPWYGRGGLTYFREENEYEIDKYRYLTLRIGRDFNISEKIGIEIDAGAMFELYHEEIVKKTQQCTGWFCDWELEMPVLPSLSLVLFYRL